MTLLRSDLLSQIADSGSAVTFGEGRTWRFSLQLQGIDAVVQRKNKTSAYKVRNGAVVMVCLLRWLLWEFRTHSYFFLKFA